MKKNSLKLMTLMLALVMVLTACGGGNKPANGNETGNETGGETAAVTEGKILRTNNKSEPGSLDPALATGTHDSWVMQHIFEGLMKYDEKGELAPGMAESYEVSEDGLVYTFKLRDAKWSNGDPVTAQDFEYSWKRVLDPELASEYSYQMYYVEGGEAYNTGEGSVDDVAIKALDDKTLEVKLVAPTPYFDGLTAFYTLYPVHKATVEANPEWAKEDVSKGNFITNGPFRITNWEHNAKIQIEKNDEYYDADAVKLGGIDFDIIEDDNTAWQKYEGGEYDFLVSPLTSVVNEMLQNDNPELIIGDDLGLYYYAFNCTRPPFDNQKVREALSLAIDRKTIVEKVTQGGQTYAEGVVPYGLYDDEGKEFRDANQNLVFEDIEKAKTLLDEGLAEAGMTKEDMNKTIVSFNTDEGHKKIAQAIQEMWKQNLGIEVSLENMEFQVLIDKRREANYDISRAGWLGDYADPMTMLDIFMHENPQNDPKYNNEEFDNLLNTAKNSPDQKVRMDSMKEAEKIIMKDLPIMPIYFYTQPYVQKPNVKGAYKTITNYPTLTYVELTDE